MAALFRCGPSIQPNSPRPYPSSRTHGRQAICTPSTPDVPTVPERQAVKLPDEGADVSSDRDARRRRRAMLSGLITSPSGATGTANTSAASNTLG